MTRKAFTPPAVGRSYRLPSGPRVRLRLVQPRDAAAITAFLAEQGLAIDDLELARLLRFDPRRRAVICASTLIGVREVVVALGAITLDASAPDIVLVGHDPDGELRALLVAALAGRRHARAA